MSIRRPPFSTLVAAQLVAVLAAMPAGAQGVAPEGTAGASAGVSTSSGTAGGAGGSVSTDPGSDASVTASTDPAAARNADIDRRLLQSDQTQFSVGARVWAFWVPRFFVDPFVTIEPGWNGSVQPAAGLEFTYRTKRMDIVLGAMFLGHSADAGFFRGVGEPLNATERIRPDLFGVYLTSHFLWSIPIHRMFEVQVGGGIGLGYIGGSLYRSQATQQGGQWQDCVMPAGGPECMNDNNHYTNGPTDPNTGLPVNREAAYREPTWFGGGYVPAIMPFISLPHVALHFRPHRNVDIRADMGYALYGFYGGGAVHFVW